MRKIAIIILLVMIGLVGYSQSPTLDTLYLYRGGKLYFLKVVTPDTLIINADTLLLSNVITSYSLSNDTLIINGTDTMLVARPMPDGGYIYHKEISVSIVQVDSLYHDSIECIANPGSNKYISVINSICRVSSNRNPNIGSGTLDMVYNNGSNATYDLTDIINRLPASAFNVADTNQWYFPNNSEAAVSITKQKTNKSVVLWLTQRQIGDDTSLKLYITYQILNK